MKTIRNWADLEPFGIRCLTGEACLLGIRALCDLTEPGQAIVREFLGLPYNAPFQEAWNSGAVGSCFLPWSVLADLAAFCLIKGGAHWAVLVEGEVHSREPGDDPQEMEKWLEFYQGRISRRYFPLRGQPAQGLSSTHAMSGRAQ